MVLSRILLDVFLCPSSIRLASSSARVAWSCFYPQRYTKVNPASLGYSQAIWLAIPMYLFFSSLLAFVCIPSRSHLAWDIWVCKHTWIRARCVQTVSRFLTCPRVSWDLVRCAKKRVRATSSSFEPWSYSSHIILFLCLFLLTCRPRHP